MKYCSGIDGFCRWKGDALLCAKHDCPKVEGGDLGGQEKRRREEVLDSATTK